MSAARVLNPAVLSEFCKIRAAPTVGRQLNRIKRDLFGAVNTAEINKIFTEELDKQQEKAVKKWGFDFRSGTPLSENTQFVWERVSFQESAYAPEMYTLTRAAHTRPSVVEPSTLDMLMDERSERENYAVNISGSDSCDESHDEAMNAAVFKVPAVLGLSSSSSSSSSSAVANSIKTQPQMQTRRRQRRITEFMKERKRLAQTPKKLTASASTPPAKRMRTNSGSSSDVHGIAAHFMPRKLQRFD